MKICQLSIFLFFFSAGSFGQVIKPAPAMGWEAFKAKMMADPEIQSVLNKTGLIMADWTAEISKRGVVKKIELTTEGPLNHGLSKRITDSLNNVLWAAGNKKWRKTKVPFSFQVVLEKHSPYLDSVIAKVIADKSMMDSLEKLKQLQNASQFTIGVTESKTEYPGGMSALFELLESNFTYPTECLEQNITSSVQLRFWVDSYGNLSDFTVVAGSESCPKFALELIRIIKLSDHWIPTTFNGQYITSWREIPIHICFE